MFFTRFEPLLQLLSGKGFFPLLGLRLERHSDFEGRDSLQWGVWLTGGKGSPPPLPWPWGSITPILKGLIPSTGAFFLSCAAVSAGGCWGTRGFINLSQLGFF